MRALYSPYFQVAIFSVFVTWNHSVWGYNTGARSESCIDILPQHRPNDVSSSSSNPFSLLISQKQLLPKGELTIVLKADKEVPIKGFLIQVRDSNSKVVGGMHIPKLSKWHAKILDCPGAKGSSVTHTSETANDGIYNVTVVWRAPKNTVSGEYTVIYSAASDFEHFWGPELSVNSTTRDSQSQSFKIEKGEANSLHISNPIFILLSQAVGFYVSS